MNISPMTPRFLQETFLNISIIVGAIVGAVGLVLWVVSGFSNWDALLCAALGAAIFFGFRKIKSLKADYEMDEPGEDSGGAP